MGLLDSIAGNAAAIAGIGNGANRGIVGAVIRMLMNNELGGLTGLLNRFTSSGLASQVNSWISTGTNQSVSAHEVKQAIGQADLERIAREANTTPEEAAHGLSQALPQIVDVMTPNGQLPEGNTMHQALSAIRSALPF